MIEIMFVIVPVLAVIIFVFVFILLLSPKARGKYMSRQLKATKYMMDELKDDVRAFTKDYADENGFSDSSAVYCKYCGRRIDEDPQFCKFCGGVQ